LPDQLSAAAPKLPLASPESRGLLPGLEQRVKATVIEEIRKGNLPGCVVAVGYQGHLVILQAYGDREIEPMRTPMTTDTVFDLASLTKPIATATSIMVLLQQGKIRLNAPVADYIPEFAASNKQSITIQQLLVHQGGLIPDNSLGDYQDGREEAMKRIYALETVVEPGTKFKYTDVGFIVLADVVQRVSGENVHEFSQKHIFKPLGMTATGYLPGPELRSRCAPHDQRDEQWIKGEVHDPRSHRLGGIAGHAGLFSTATDLAVYAQMMLNGGRYYDARPLGTRTIETMTMAYPVSSGLRGLGWDKQTGYSSNKGELLSDRAFGHGGFTGTAMWIDPEIEMFVIFLSNRLHPDGKGSVNRLAGRIATLAAASINTPLKSGTDEVHTGVDILQEDKYASLRGQRVGLIANQTSIDRRGRSTIQLMHESPHVQLVALFSPEHGIVGKLDQSIIGDTKETTTGLKVFSLYGKNRAPTEEFLSEIDTLVFDIQDIGTRFYTYISTMGLAMEACSQHNKRFVVLDRPNPINGVRVAGPVLDAGRESFVGYHTLPVRHGMTVGELARMFRAERGWDLKLDVIKVKGWDPASMLDRSGLPWVNPSPNMRNLNQALFYPGVGLLETTNLSVGRGTDTPFEWIGAPWLDGQRFAHELNTVGIPGIRFVATQFTPQSSVYQGKQCNGVRFIITNRAALEPLRLGMELATKLRALHPNDWDRKRYVRLLCDARTMALLEEQATVDEIIRSWEDELIDFRKRRSHYLLYER
jgi:uncharacterized protein YbbC (DUF1343 family)